MNLNVWELKKEIQIQINLMKYKIEFLINNEKELVNSFNK